MRLIRILTIVVAIGAIVATHTPAAVAATPPKVIRLISVTVTSKETDRPPKGASKGDRTVGSSRLYNGDAQFGKKAGEAVGRDQGVFVLRDKTTLYATGAATLPGGTLKFAGVAKVEGGTFVIPVVSGTGVFLGATGSLLIPIAPPDTRIVANVYQLRYESVA
ncbi:MAG: dirigent protein [Actinobacteria bacterium]|nr:dirigent protein [Actinomycetota bacterium]